MKRILGFFGLCVLLASCGEEIPQKDLTIDTQKMDTVVLNSATGLKPVLRLTPQANKAVKNWTSYQTLNNLIPSFREVTLASFKEDISKCVGAFQQQEQAEEAEISLHPENVNTAAIMSRLLVVETKTKILNDLAFKARPNIEQLELEIVALKNAFQDLNLQINERFAKSVEEMLEEIRKAEEALEDPNASTPSPQNRPRSPQLQKQ